MANRTLLTLLTALLLGATLSAPLVASAESGYGADHRLSAAVGPWVALPTSSSEGDFDDVCCPTEPLEWVVFGHRSNAFLLPNQLVFKRTAERPQARAPPHYL